MKINKGVKANRIPCLKNLEISMADYKQLGITFIVTYCKSFILIQMTEARRRKISKTSSVALTSPFREAFS